MTLVSTAARLRTGDSRRVCAAALLAMMTVFPAAAKAQTAERIVSVGGAVTEIIYALGEQDRIVAVDTTSIFPRETDALPKVGYMRQLAAEGVLSLNPDLVLAIEGSGPQPAIDVLKASAVPYIEVPESFAAEGILKKIEVVGEALGATEQAEKLKGDVAADLEATRAAVAQSPVKPAVVFVLSTGGPQLMVSGSGTAASAVIEMAGGRNVFDSFEGYKPVNSEALLAAAPEYILTMKRPDHDPSEAIRAMPGFELTPAGKDDHLIAMNGLYLLGFGPRTAEAIRDLGRAIGTIPQ